jgi:hypothetical protein
MPSSSSFCSGIALSLSFCTSIAAETGGLFSSLLLSLFFFLSEEEEEEEEDYIYEKSAYVTEEKVLNLTR